MSCYHLPTSLSVICAAESFVDVWRQQTYIDRQPVLQNESQTGVDTGLCFGALYPHPVPNHPQDRGQAVHRGSHASSAGAGLAPFQLAWGRPLRCCAPLHRCSCSFCAVQLTHVSPCLEFTTIGSCLCLLTCLATRLSQALFTHTYVSSLQIYNTMSEKHYGVLFESQS